MKEKAYETPSGVIRYRVADKAEKKSPQLVFLPGLGADHRLFEKQTEFFEGKYPVFVWDPPGHAGSWPFRFDFSLMDTAKWLREILALEGFEDPILVGQSMGGYTAQAFAELCPEKIRGFVSIDSAPLGREYVSGLEIWLLKRTEPVYRYYPWKSLLRSGTNGVSVTEYGRKLMHEMMSVYEGQKERYAKLSGHGSRILAEAMESGCAWKIPCPALLICGEKDRAGSAKRYNRKWHEKTGVPLAWIPDAGHNANTDAPDAVNRLIGEVISEAEKESACPG